MNAAAFRKRCLAAHYRLEAELADEEADRLEAQARARAFRAAWSQYVGRPTTRSKALAKDYARYLGNAWPRERELWKLPDSATPKRKALHRFARSRDGNSLSWRAIFDFAAIHAVEPFEAASRFVQIDS